MPYISYDENGNITGQFANQQFNPQLYTDLIIDDFKKFKVINGNVEDITTSPEYIAAQKTKENAQYLKEFAEKKDACLYVEVFNGMLLRTGEINQEIYEARIAENDTDYLAAVEEFYAKTGFVKPTITV